MEQAQAFCAQFGLVVDEFEVGPSCTEGQYESVEFTCCPAEPNPCFNSSLGDQFSTSCEAPSFWLNQAQDICGQADLVVADHNLLEPCAEGLYPGMNFYCCDPVPEPEPDPCFYHTFGEQISTMCEPAEFWTAAAQEICADGGLVLGSTTLLVPGAEGIYSGLEPCDEGLYTAIEFACCPAEVEPEPEPEPCFEESLGGINSTSCKTEALWLQYAQEVCDASGFVVAFYELGETCGPDLYVGIKFKCCPETSEEIQSPIFEFAK